MVNSWIKAPLKILWRLLAPVRRPLLRKLDQRIAAVVLRALADRHHELLGQILDSRKLSAAAEDRQQTILAELNMLAESIVRELMRLQRQMEAIEAQVAALDRLRDPSQSECWHPRSGDESPAGAAARPLHGEAA